MCAFMVLWTNKEAEMTGGVQRFARLVEHKPIGRITVWKLKQGEGVCDTVNRIRSFVSFAVRASGVLQRKI